MPSHYDTLEVDPTATPDEIKSAYRALARKLHPDVNSSSNANEEFQKVQLAYEVLSDPDRRSGYDSVLQSQRRPVDKAEKERREAEELRLKAEAMMREAQVQARIDPELTSKLTQLLAIGKVTEAESLAQDMLQRDSRQPVPYAVLGDIARIRGEFKTALRYYGLAAQYEPKNPIYQRRYEEMLNAGSGIPVTDNVSIPEVKFEPITVGIFLVVVMAAYVAMSPEKPLGVQLVSHWTVGSFAMLFLAGIVAGACLSLSKALASFGLAAGSAVMKVSPAMAVGFVSVVSFWAACLVYFAIGQSQQAFNRSVSMLLGTVAGVTGVFALATWPHGNAVAFEHLLWGGNLVYFGALSGWYVTDAFGRSSSA